MTWEYIAGLYDGEGNLSPREGKISWRVGLTQVDRTVLASILTFLQEHGITRAKIRRARKKRKKWKACYSLNIENRIDVVIFLRGVWPHLIVKRQLAQDVLRFLRMYGPLRGPMHRANKRQTCRRGHVYDYFKPDGRRECRTCIGIRRNRK